MINKLANIIANQYQRIEALRNAGLQASYEWFKFEQEINSDQSEIDEHYNYWAKVRAHNFSPDPIFTEKIEKLEREQRAIADETGERWRAAITSHERLMRRESLENRVDHQAKRAEYTRSTAALKKKDAVFLSKKNIKVVNQFTQTQSFISMYKIIMHSIASDYGFSIDKEYFKKHNHLTISKNLTSSAKVCICYGVNSLNRKADNRIVTIRETGEQLVVFVPYLVPYLGFVVVDEVLCYGKTPEIIRFSELFPIKNGVTYNRCCNAVELLALVELNFLLFGLIEDELKEALS